jgi:type IV pilus assembly protein PilM
MFERVVLGLDVGSYSVKAVELRAGLRGVAVVRCEEQPLPAAPPEEREAALFAFARERNLPLDHVVAALPSDRVTQRHLRFPFTDSRRIAQAVPFELEDALPIPLEGAVLTWESAKARDHTDVLAAVSPRAEVAAFLHELRQAGVEPRVLEVDGAALANLSSSLPLADAPRLILDVGHRKTNLVLLVEGKPAALRSIPVAGKLLTEALAEDLGLSPEAAAAHKHSRGVFEGPRAKPASLRVARVLERLAREIRRTLESLSGDPLGGLAPGEIVLVGGSARLAGLDVWLAQALGLPCARLEVPPTDPELAPLADGGAAVFAQAAALALRGSPTGRVTATDFRRGEFAYSPDLAHLRRSAAVTAGLAALSLVLWLGSLAIERAARERRADALEARIAELYQAAFGAAPPNGDAFAALEQRARETRELASHLGVTDHGLSALEVLRELSARIPAELDVSLTELAVERRTIQARGYARDFESVDRVRAELARYEWFSEVRLTDVVSDPRSGGKTFNLTVRLAEAT